MDSETIITILLVLLYLAFQFVGRKKRPAPPRQEAPPIPSGHPAGQPQGSTDLEEALRQIREALGGGAEASAPKPEPAPVQTRLPLPPATPPVSRLPERRSGKEKQPEPFLSAEDRFESRAPSQEFRSPLVAREPRIGESRLQAVVKKAPGPAEGGIPLVMKVEALEKETLIPNLKDRKVLREAFITTEILGPPVSERYREG